MTNKIIKDFMTISPQTININQSLDFASKKMAELKVRHLPVLNGGELVGVLSDRDIRFVESFEKLDPNELKVEDAYSEGAYSVDQKTSLSLVCKTMSEEKYGCVLVLDDQKLVGIFTWIDALRILGNL